MKPKIARHQGGDGDARPESASTQGDLIAELERRVGAGQATKLVEITTGAAFWRLHRRETRQ